MDTDGELSVVNMVSSGKFDVELDLAKVAEDLRKFEFITEVEHSRRRGNRLLIEFEGSDGLGILAPTGVYVFTGVETFDETERLRKSLLTALSELEIISSIDPHPDEIVDEFEVKNLVINADTGQELNLDALTIGLGLEKTEYEPEQFPGLVYRPPSHKCTILIFSSGKVVLTGAKQKSTAREAFEDLKEQVSGLMETT